MTTRFFLPLFYRLLHGQLLQFTYFSNQIFTSRSFLLESINMRISTPPIICARIMFRILCKLFIEGANRESVSPLSLRSWSQCLMTPLSCTWYTSTVCSFAGYLLLVKNMGSWSSRFLIWTSRRIFIKSKAFNFPVSDHKKTIFHLFHTKLPWR